MNPRPSNLDIAKARWGEIPQNALWAMQELIDRYKLSISMGDLHYINGNWYVSHAGLLRLARRHHCASIEVQILTELCDVRAGRWVFRATVYKSERTKGFVGYGDADPSNVSPLVHGAEMRVAETRAVNRALRKAYGIGICSVEEIGAFAGPTERERVRKQPPQSDNGNGEPKLRDQLCLLIRQQRLDASLVKQYAAEFCGAQDLRQAKREQIQGFITHLAEQATKDREGLLCKLNSFAQKPAGAA